LSSNSLDLVLINPSTSDAAFLFKSASICARYFSCLANDVPVVPLNKAGVFSKINLCSFNCPATSPTRLIKFSQHQVCY